MQRTKVKLLSTTHQPLIYLFLIYCISFSGVYTGLTPFLQLFDYKHKQVHEENIAEIREHVVRKRHEVTKHLFSHIFLKNVHAYMSSVRNNLYFPLTVLLSGDVTI